MSTYSAFRNSRRRPLVRAARSLAFFRLASGHGRLRPAISKRDLRWTPHDKTRERCRGCLDDCNLNLALIHLRMPYGRPKNGAVRANWTSPFAKRDAATARGN